MPDDIILSTGPLGGLGDHLIYSTLPERYALLGHDVYLDRDNLCRNDEIHDIIWAHNPFIKGTTDRKPNAGYVNQGAFYDIANRFPIGSVEAMERAHHLPPPYSIAPRIYYEPRPFTIDLSDSVLVDFSAISSTIAAQGISDTLVKMNDRFPGKNFLQVTFPSGIIRQGPGIEGPSIRVNSIFEYADALGSCYAWVGSEAGGQSLAAAVRGPHDVYDLVARPEIVCVISPKTFNSRGYTYRGIDYRVTVYGNVSGDYWDAYEVPYQRYQQLCRRTVEEARAIYAAEKAAREALNASV